MYLIPRPAETKDLEGDPFEVKSPPCFFYPGYVTARLVSQRGLFTIHPEPAEAYNPPQAKQLVIKGDVKAEFRCKLDAMGIHHGSIYADLDNLSRRLVNLQGFRSRPALKTANAPVPTSRQRPTTTIEPKPKVNPRDPQKGQWGSERKRNGFELSALVTKVETDWYRIVLTVRAVPDNDLTVRAVPDNTLQLKGIVTFYLHDTFEEPIVQVPAANGEATVKRFAYGAFTVGVRLEDGTELELDLADLKDAPRRFREQ